MYNVVLHRDSDTKPISETFSSYYDARDYANRIFHQQYTLNTREKGYPVEDLIVFNKNHYSSPEKICVHGSDDLLSLSIAQIIDSATDNEDIRASNTASSIDNLSVNQSAKSNFERESFSLNDHMDSIHIRKELIAKLIQKTPPCPECGEVLSSKKNVTIKKIDRRSDYTPGNVYLKHRECRDNGYRFNIQFLYTD